MSTTTHPTPPLPPLTAEDFKGGTVVAGIDLSEDENANWVIAFGHLDKTEYAHAVNAYDTGANGEPYLDGDQYTEEDVQHAHAVTITRPPEWWISLRNVTAETPGAFPVTVVFR